jgi:hypothetical protein
VAGTGKHTKHECPYCSAVWRCSGKRTPFAEHIMMKGKQCGTPYYWPCTECWQAKKWSGDKQFQEHVTAHYGYTPSRRT